MRYYQCDTYPIEFVLSENIDKHFEAHNHAGHYVISQVVQGTAVVCLENEKQGCRKCRRCQKGDVFVIPPYAMHSVYQGKDARLLSVCIGTSFVAETALGEAQGIIRELLRNTKGLDIIGKKHGEQLPAFVREVYHLRETGGKTMDADMKILADKIARHPEQETSIEALAAGIFVSKYYFIRKFKRSIGMTPRQFCIQNRIRRSQGLLDAERTIGEVSAEMGFYDQSHFNKAFQRIVGITPSEYMNSKNRIQWNTAL